MAATGPTVNTTRPNVVTRPKVPVRHSVHSPRSMAYPGSHSCKDSKKQTHAAARGDVHSHSQCSTRRPDLYHSDPTSHRGPTWWSRQYMNGWAPALALPPAHTESSRHSSKLMEPVPLRHTPGCRGTVARVRPVARRRDRNNCLVKGSRYYSRTINVA